MAGEAFPTLETARLRLREIVASDAPALYEIHGDRDAMKWFGRDPITTFSEAEELVENFASLRTMINPGVRWGIELRETPPPAPGVELPAEHGLLIGTCGLFRWNRGWKVCVVGYELARTAQGRGFMREALGASFRWGFQHMSLERIEAQVHPENTPSLALLKSLGFVEEGLAREAGFWLGKRHDMVQLGLLRRELVED